MEKEYRVVRAKIEDTYHYVVHYKDKFCRFSSKRDLTEDEAIALAKTEFKPGSNREYSTKMKDYLNKRKK
jgi:hypothetical protein